MDGWIKLHRKISDNPLWLSEPFTRGQAWVDLIVLAQYQPGAIRKRGILVKLPVGTVGRSQQTLAERWQWSRGKVIRFLGELETVQQIVQQKNNVTTLIHIVNYNHYQGASTANGTTDGTTDGHQTVQEQEVKEVKKKETTLCPHKKIIEYYNGILKKLPRVQEKLWNGTREKNLKARWREDISRQDLKWWELYFVSISEMPFLCGENDRGWTADLAWLVNQTNMAKVLEGKYNNLTKAGYHPMRGKWIDGEKTDEQAPLSEDLLNP